MDNPDTNKMDRLLPTLFRARGGILFPGILSAIYLLVTSNLISLKPAWIDEIYTYLQLEHSSLSAVLESYSTCINGVPLPFFVVAYGWTDLCGNSIESLRWFSALWGLLTLWCWWFLLRRYLGIVASSIALCVVAVASPSFIFQSIDARFYTFFVFAAVLACLTTLKLSQNQNCTWTLLILNTLANIVLIKAHFFGLFYSGALALACLACRKTQGYSWFVATLSFSLAWLAYLPMLGWLQRFFSLYDSIWGGWIAEPTSYSLFEPLPGFLSWQPIILTILLVIFAYALAPQNRQQLESSESSSSNSHLFPLFVISFSLILLPYVFVLVSLWYRPLLVTRYFLPTILGWSLLIGLAVEIIQRYPISFRLHLTPETRERWSRLLLVCSLLYLAASLLGFLSRGDNVHRQAREFVRELDEQELPVASFIDHAYLPLLYYGSAEVPVRFLRPEYDARNQLWPIFNPLVQVTDVDEYLESNPHFLLISLGTHRLNEFRRKLQEDTNYQVTLDRTWQKYEVYEVKRVEEDDAPEKAIQAQSP